MKGFEKITGSIYRITTTYKDIFTTVYLLIAKNGAILFDTASFDEDVDEVLVPALEQMGITAEKLKYVFISHSHKDHAGGLARFVTHYPEATIVSRSPMLREKYEGHPFLFPEEGTMLLDTYRVIPIVGHTADSAALLDTRTNTLVTGDCLQLWGICGSEDWAANINFPAEHLEVLEKLEEMPLSAIYTAHDYYPLGYCAVGKKQIERFFAMCREPLARIKGLILSNPEADDATIREMYNACGKMPTVREAVVRAVRGAVKEQNEKKDKKKKLTKAMVHKLLKADLWGELFDMLFFLLFFGGLLAVIIYTMVSIDVIYGVFLLPMSILAVIVVIRARHFMIAARLVLPGRFHIAKDKFSHSVDHVYVNAFYKLSFEAFFNIPFAEGRGARRHLYYFYAHGEVITDSIALPYAKNGTEVYLVVLDNKQGTVVDYFFDARFYELKE